MKILLLEDELMLQSAIVEYLTDTGYAVDAFEDGQDAFNASLENAYDLFIFDINTPTVDGLTLLENLQKKEDLCSDHFHLCYYTDRTDI